VEGRALGDFQIVFSCVLDFCELVTEGLLDSD